MTRILFYCLPISLWMFVACSKPIPTSPFSNLKVKWVVFSNQEKETPECHAGLWFINEGTDSIKADNWDFYFNHSPRKVRKTSGAGELTQISGDFYKLEPKEDFIILPGDSLLIEYYTAAWLIKESDGPRGAYVYFSDGQAAMPIPVKTSYFWQSNDALTRHKADSASLPTPKYLFERNRMLEDMAPPIKNTFTGFNVLGDKASIHYEKGLENEANYLKKTLGYFSSSTIELKEFKKIKNSDDFGTINLTFHNFLTHKEGYQFTYDNRYILVAGNSPQGIFYGIQDLLRTLSGDSLHLEENGFSHIDFPRFEYRGLHLDVARNFHKVKTVKKLMDAMAFYRLNVLHLHLTEDEGWRLEIPGLPELTEVGGQRKHGGKDDNVLHPSYGSGPFKESDWGSGFYSREEYIDLLKYAKSLHIKVIPEINFPGHARAAIKAMNARHERLMAEGKKEAAEKYWLIDPDDQSKYLSAQHYTDNISCVCKESVFDFYDKVLDEVASMYAEAGASLDIVHTGGDEVPAGAWEGSPICQEFLKSHPEIKEFKDLEKYFHRRLAQNFAERGYQLAGWEEIAMNKDGSVNPEFVEDQFLCYVWNTLWGATDLGNRLVNSGYPVILCNVTNLYFDLAYNGDPEEAGLYWGGYVDTRDAFSMMPLNVFASTRRDNMDKLIDYSPRVDGIYSNMEKLQLNKKDSIKGIQAQLWSETIEGPEMLEHYALPKLIGMAEVAWNNRLENQEGVFNAYEIRMKKWKYLAARIGTEDLPILDKLSGGYLYRIPPPGAMIKDGILHANVEFPGLKIFYTIKGSKEVKEYTKPVSVNGEINIWTENSQGRKSKIWNIGPRVSSQKSIFPKLTFEE
ncbi:MAG: carbohydate-binding domain-containing protein [Bacteroidia bacterium]|nr:carbohydate-binding domain-containing protein [Bacteroidia bacterium]